MVGVDASNRRTHSQEAPVSGTSDVEEPRPRTSSPLTLADRLISIARELDRTGFHVEAASLIEIAHKVLDQAPANPAQSGSDADREAALSCSLSRAS
jgi:hypothetical protein